LAGNDVVAIFEDSQGNLWFGTGGGVTRFDGTIWTTYTTADGLADNYVQAVAEDADGNLWFATGQFGGACRFDGVTWTTYTTEDGLADNRVQAIIKDSHGDLWFGTGGYGGVSRYDGVTWTTYTTADGLLYNNVTTIIEDSNGNLWFGTGWFDIEVGPYGGVSRFDRVDWTTYTMEDLPDDDVRAIIEDSHGNLWFATWWGGVSRFDRVGWTTFTTEDGLADRSVLAVIEDTDGTLWFGTAGGGVSTYDGADWFTYTTEQGLACNSVLAIIEDSQGDLWFGTAGAGVSRYDGAEWTTFTTEDGLADDYVTAILEDSNGDFWFGSWAGVSRYDGVAWTTYSAEDGLAEGVVRAILEDSSGNLWFGTTGFHEWQGGASRYDGLSWTTFTAEDGLADDNVRAIIEDSQGDLWFGTSWGLSRYDGFNWTTYSTEDELVANSVGAIIEDSRGNLWFGTSDGVTMHEPDRVGPHTVIWPRPPQLSPNTIQTIAFSASFGEVGGVTFSHSMDGSDWSEWASVNSWTASGLPDGEHVFKVRARDRCHNVDRTPGTCVFEIDATPPSAIITHPAFGKAVRSSVTISGTAVDPRFSGYVIEARAVASPSWSRIASSESPVTEGTLGTWDTEPLSDGDYELRLSVTDSLGLTGTGLVRVTVDNEPPWAWETAPTVVKASAGGNVYTTNGEVRLYFPPWALAADAVVSLATPDGGSVPDSLDGGAKLVLEGYDISWKGEELKKPISLEMALGESAGRQSPDEVFALYVLPKGNDDGWQRLGGTVSSGGQSISASIYLEGTYSLFTDSGGLIPGEGLSALMFTPRVFSPRGSFGNTEVAISFILGRPGPVTVKVHNRAGRLIRQLAGAKHMNAGSNLVRWDGRGGDGAEVPGGLYLVTVEALGETRVKTLMVVK
jgi:hypothetical protein